MKCGDREIEPGLKTYVMGILNITPDSFSDGGSFLNSEKALRQALKMCEEGADVIDVGAESTRPFAEFVNEKEELCRILPVVKSLVKEGIRNISIDTRKASVADACLAEGASWINDVSALSFDRNMAEVAKMADGVVLMHMRGLPENMQKDNPKYENVVEEVFNFLSGRVEFSLAHGIQKNKLWIDPGIGFGKRVIEDNVLLTRKLSRFKDLGLGVLYGASRKNFLGKILGEANPKLRDNATLGACAVAVQNGADMVRVHEVKSCVEMLKIIDAMVRVEIRQAA